MFENTFMDCRTTTEICVVEFGIIVALLLSTALLLNRLLIKKQNSNLAAFICQWNALHIQQVSSISPSIRSLRRQLVGSFQQTFPLIMTHRAKAV